MMWILTSLLLAQTSAPSTVQEETSRDDAWTPGIKLKTRVHGRYRHQEAPQDTQAFELVRARFALKIKAERWLRAEVDVDLADPDLLRDGFVDAKYLKRQHLVVGAFKKPFGTLRLLSQSDLQIYQRGIVNDFFAEDLAYGDRDIGAMARGRFGDFRYAVGVFNGAELRPENNTGKDAVARVSYRLSHVELAMAGSLKHRNTPGVQWPRKTIVAGNVSAHVRGERLEVISEAFLGQRDVAPKGPEAWGAVVYAIHKFFISERVRLAPVFKAEWLDEHRFRSADESLSVLGGINVYLGESLRIFAQAEARRPQGRASSVVNDNRFVLQLSFDHGMTLREAP